ncbi:MAG: hypothetical protein ABL893_15890, partial [Hyphomicrobium sp.]
DSPRVADELNLRYEEFTGHDIDEYLTDTLRRDALSYLKAKAHTHATVRPVYKRLAWVADEQAIYLDLSRPDGACARITHVGWDIVVPKRPMFVRLDSQRPLPHPVPSDDGAAAFARLMPPSMSAEQNKLLLGALMGCLIPSNFAASFSYPVLVVHGDSGSGKSTLTKTIKVLVDNEVATAARRPNNVDDLYVAAQSAHLLAFDNLDNINANISDAICQATTGGAIVKRKLYTDSELTVLPVHAPFLLNGINPLLERQDIVDRSITIPLSRITQYDPNTTGGTSSELPKVLGHILDLMSRALDNYTVTELDNLPRLATVATFVAAAEPFGCSTPFIDLLNLNQRETLICTDEHHPVIDALIETLTVSKAWHGTYKELLAHLASKTSDASSSTPEWPKTPRKLSSFLNHRLRTLRELGIDVVQGARRNNGRLVTLTRLAKFAQDKPSSGRSSNTPRATDPPF